MSKTSGNAMTVIKCEPVLDINDVADLKAHLLEALQSSKSIEINAGEVDRIDAAALQLFFAFVREAKQADIQVNWVSCSTAFEQSASLLGMREQMGLS
ncbi:MAG: STAS domain-containing protein [Gammaproteobacteria bacterium]|nr:STAS domain-containing protein [Gammaproteobacteria bacterium]MDH5728901.1 STAS domain-containing protein [Gammaproteobacteria bacterium]